MRAGRINRRVLVQRRVDTQDASGQPIPEWVTIGAPRWADRQPAGGSEKFGSDQFLAREQIVWELRWTSDLENLNPKDRIVYPVTSSPVDSEIYEILNVGEIGRRQGFRILTARRSEV